MSRKIVTVTEIEAGFPRFLHDAERGECIVITRQGEPVAALLSADYLSQLECAGDPGEGRFSTAWPTELMDAPNRIAEGMLPDID